ncbi:MarR family winged helix-turn-helix transcriptional regulator [Anianabacter salinae]|uniref:MarR family winged helix-turn-helix transcriptional regulator n=1 Tax=Anianabacter salinae TaxID=2851023 RepID=UPI00225E69E9|nr:MarR family transcriptional regulator [Anianabacter salinae]MBV0913402.1 MarR family transcriptional regulator [Anianabacter salinae]
MTDFILDDFLPYQLAVLAEQVSRDFSLRYRKRFGISIAEWRVVAHLSQERPDTHISVGEICRRVSLEKSKVSRAATRLEAAGYVQKRPHPEDGRLVALQLTPKGRAMVAELTPIARAFEAEVMQRLGPDGAAFRAAIGTLLGSSSFGGVGPDA